MLLVTTSIMPRSDQSRDSQGAAELVGGGGGGRVGGGEVGGGGVVSVGRKRPIASPDPYFNLF